MKPIIFNTAMVRALMSGKKTQTRRVVTNKFALELPDESGFTPEFVANPDNYLCPYYDKEDKLMYVRETFYLDEVDGYYYRATAMDCEDFNMEGIKWKPSIHLPKIASRLFLLVEDVKIERVQDITEEDAMAEGVQGEHDIFHDSIQASIENVYKRNFAVLWDSINKKRGYGWDKNPWTFCVTFNLYYERSCPYNPKTEGEPIGKRKI